MPAVRMPAMRRKRWILLLAGLMLLVVAGWLWWLRPQKADMASYAPADSLLFLEANRPLAVVEAIAGTEAWKSFDRVMGTTPSAPHGQWLQGLIGWTGIGPIQSVILARAQIAVVVTDLGTAEEGESLSIKPEGVILIETHTAEFRVRPQFEQALKALAEKTYVRPSLRQVTQDGVVFTQWSAPDGSRQIVGTTVGSLVIVGNSERAVHNCVAVSLGRRPRLKDDPELNRMRLQLQAENALAFGYVPPGNSPRLLAVGVPLLLGRAPADSEFQRLITNGAAKVFGSLGWTSAPYLTGIEDRYLIGLQPSFVARLKPSFGSANLTSQMARLLPPGFYSVTSYKFVSPAATLQSLKSAVSSQVDALSAIVFASILKSALQSYGIDDPEKFLGAVNGELLTVRLDENAERSVLIAGIRDRTTLRDLVSKNMRANQRHDGGEQVESFEDPSGEFAATFVDDYVVTGSSADVRRYVETTKASPTRLSTEELRRITFFVSESHSSNIITYTDDGDRVRNFLVAIMEARGTPILPPARIEQAVSGLPYSVTETTLDDRGFERTTRSPLGQFSTLFPMLFPEKPSPIINPSQPN